LIGQPKRLLTCGKHFGSSSLGEGW
jgi:hypothetical protein